MSESSWEIIKWILVILVVVVIIGGAYLVFHNHLFEYFRGSQGPVIIRTLI